MSPVVRSAIVTPARLRAKSHREVRRSGGAARPLTSRLSIAMSAVTSPARSTDFIEALPLLRPSMAYPRRSASCVKGVRSKLRRRSVSESARLREATPSRKSSWSWFSTKKRSMTTREVSIWILRAKICHVLSPRVTCEGRMRRSMTRPLGPGSSSTSACRPISPDTRRTVSVKPVETSTRP